MFVKQVSVFLENKEGRLYEVCHVLGDAGINIRALCIAETADYGVVRMIVSDPEKAISVLRNSGFTVSETDVLAVVVPDKPGGLAQVLRILKDAMINVEYLYCFIEPGTDRAIDIMRVENTEAAINVLKDGNVEILTPAEVYGI